VLEAAVVGVPDRDWGERVRACVVRRPQRSVDAAVIQAHCKQRLSGAKVPREVVFMTALPRNPTGKVSKRELVVLSNEILEAASRGGA
jgi:fatty-acyl-CoA synthase